MGLSKELFEIVKISRKVNISLGFVKFLVCQACDFFLVVLKDEKLFSLVCLLRHMVKANFSSQNAPLLENDLTKTCLNVFEFLEVGASKD